MDSPLKTDLEGILILIVEDSQTQALALKEALEKQKLQTSIAHDGVEALQMLQSLHPDVVISDIQMPRMNGYDLCRHIKTDAALKTIPVLLLTNLTDSMDVIKGVECGADSFLTKPYEMTFLMAAIENALENKRLHNEMMPGKLEFFFGGQKHLLHINQSQIMELLLSTYSNAIQKNLELEQAFRKLNILYEELERKNIALKQLNEEKNLLLGMAVHDLRNPLSIIAGYTDLIVDTQKESFDENTHKMLQHVKKSSEFMHSLVKDLLTMSAIESGTVSLHLAEIDLGQFLKETVELQQILAEKKRIQLTFSSASTQKVVCDPPKIAEVVNNLVNNAIKFSHEGGSIEVTLTPRENEVTLTVKDHGVGILPEAREHLFQPFSKSRASGTNGEHGTGLGLTIAQKIVAEHKGKIWVESEPNVGTTFFITLPYRPVNGK